MAISENDMSLDLQNLLSFINKKSTSFVHQNLLPQLNEFDTCHLSFRSRNTHLVSFVITNDVCVQLCNITSSFKKL